MEIIGIGICWKGAWDKKGQAQDGMKIPSPVKQSSVGDRQMFRSPPKIARRRKSMRNSRGGDNNWLSWMKKYKEVVVEEEAVPSCEYDHMNMNMVSASPYYKGLTDQSLAISYPPPPPPPPPPHVPPPLLLSPAGYSPYYKGLTDFSLVIHTSHSHSHHAPPTNNSPSSLISSSYASSPYYRGLIDYSLALALHPPNSLSSLKHPPSHHLEDHITTDHGKPLSVVYNESSSKPTFQEILDFDHASVAVQVQVQVEGRKPLSVYESSQPVLQDDYDDVETEQEKKEILVSDLETTDPVLPENADLDLEEMQEEKRDLVEQHIINEKTDLEDCGLGTAEQTQLPLPLPCDELKLKLKEEGNVCLEYLWAIKYQPKTLAEFICNRDKALQLKALIKEGCGCNHFIFEGPPNVGKRSMIRAMLREVFGADRVQVTEEYKYFNIKGEMVDDLKLRMLKSLHHVEVNLSEAKGYEKHVIVELFKETYDKVINTTLPCIPENCHAIVLYEAEKLSFETLLYIKWLLEKYKGCSKVFFCCSDESRLQPIKSLCTTVRLSSPSTQEIVRILEYIGIEEGLKLSHESVNKIVLRSKNNLRQAIRSLEATCRNNYTLNDDDIILTGWEDAILNIAKNIVAEQSPRQLYAVRIKLQSLIAHDVHPDHVYKCLVAELMNLVDPSLRLGVAKLDNDYNKGSEQLLYANAPSKKHAMNYLKVEEFIAKFMSWYKKSVTAGI